MTTDSLTEGSVSKVTPGGAGNGAACIALFWTLAILQLNLVPKKDDSIAGVPVKE